MITKRGLLWPPILIVRNVEKDISWGNMTTDGRIARYKSG